MTWVTKKRKVKLLDQLDFPLWQKKVKWGELD
jgi:hypothetical protein